jgi:hypothetical protein
LRQNDPELAEAFARWQNMLPLYNMRMQNLSAAVIRPQLPEVARRVRDGRANHDYVAERLNTSAWMNVPDALGPRSARRTRSSSTSSTCPATTTPAPSPMPPPRAGVKVQVFGLSTDNARAFWNWNFIPGERPTCRRPARC